MTALRPTIKRIIRLLIITLVTFCVFAFVLFFFQRSLLYFPSHGTMSSALEPWNVGGKTIGYCKTVDEPEFVWLMLHGNAGQAADREYALNVLPTNVSLYVVEYPGYGSRDGKPSMRSINDAAREAYHKLREIHADSPIGIIGESIGTGPASILAGETPSPDRIALITPYDSLANVAASRLPWLPVRFLLLDRWDNSKALQGYNKRIDIYGAVDDQVIPVSHAKHLAKQVPGATFHSISGGHNEWSLGQKIRLQH